MQSDGMMILSSMRKIHNEALITEMLHELEQFGSPLEGAQESVTKFDSDLVCIRSYGETTIRQMYYSKSWICAAKLCSQRNRSGEVYVLTGNPTKCKTEHRKVDEVVELAREGLKGKNEDLGIVERMVVPARKHHIRPTNDS